MTCLTDRQRRVVDAIAAYIAENGWPPTIRELADELGFRSTNGVSEVLDAIERKGFIARSRTKARGIRVLQS